MSPGFQLRESATRAALGMVLAAVLALPAAAADTIHNAPKREWDRNALARIGPMLQERIDDGGLSGGIFMVWRDGRLVYETSRGVADKVSGEPWQRGSVARIFSMTKPVTAVAVMQLVDRGELLLSDDLEDYLPEFANAQVLTGVAGVEFLTEPAKRPIQVRDLLTHMAGLTYNFLPTPLAASYTELGIQPGDNRPAEGKRQDSLASMVRDAATLPLVAHPGESWHYSIGLDVAGRLVEVVSGMKFEDYLEKHVFEPLGMADTTFYTRTSAELDRLVPLYARSAPGGDLFPLDLKDGEVPSAWASRPAVVSGGGGLLSTPADYGRFMLMLLGGGKLDDVRVLSAASARLLMADHSSPIYGQTPDKWDTYRETRLNDGRGLGYGLGGDVIVNSAWAGTSKTPGSYSWGGAASTFFWVDPEKDLAGVFFTQLLPLFDLGQEEGNPEGQEAKPATRVIDQLRPRLIHLVYASLED